MCREHGLKFNFEFLSGLIKRQFACSVMKKLSGVKQKQKTWNSWRKLRVKWGSNLTLITS